jgi:hypothetical protein
VAFCPFQDTGKLSKPFVRLRGALIPLVWFKIPRVIRPRRKDYAGFVTLLNQFPRGLRPRESDFQGYDGLQNVLLYLSKDVSQTPVGYQSSQNLIHLRIRSMVLRALQSMDLIVANVFALS